MRAAGRLTTRRRRVGREQEAAAAGVGRFVFVSASFPPFPASIPLRFVQVLRCRGCLDQRQLPSSFGVGFIMSMEGGGGA